MADEDKDKDPSFAERWKDEIYSTRQLDVPPVLYHYTDAGGLAGALSSGQVWATDFRFLNDKQEIKHGLDQAKSIISERRRKSSGDEILQRFYNVLSSYADTVSLNIYYIFSLSSQEDDLSQWRGYAREGLGFTMGLSGPELCRYADGDDADFSLVKVVYDEKMQLRSLNRAFDEAEKILKSLLKEGESNDEIIEDIASDLDLVIEALASISKHKSFKSENEWRLISVSYTDEHDQDIKVRVRGLQLIPYIEINASKHKKLLIERIGIGPGFAGSEVTLAVDALLKQHGYTVDVYSADTPYRRV